MDTENNSNIDLMRRAFKAATGSGKIKDFWDLQDDRVEAKVAGDGILSGTYRGKADQDWIPCSTLANLAQFKKPQGCPAGEIATKLISVFADDDLAVAVYTVKTRDGDELGAVVGRIRDGRFSKVWHFDPIIEKGLDALAGDKNPDPPPPPPKPKESFTT